MVLLMLRMVLLVVDDSRPRMVHRKMVGRRQALCRVGMMLEGHVS